MALPRRGPHAAVGDAVDQPPRGQLQQRIADGSLARRRQVSDRRPEGGPHQRGDRVGEPLLRDRRRRRDPRRRRHHGSPQAYNGSAVAGFPNFFFLLGPNTGLDPALTARTLSAVADEAARLLLTDPEHYPVSRLVAHADWLLGQLGPGP